MSDDHYSLSSRVFHAIREDILNGKYQANEELKEKSIGEEMGAAGQAVQNMNLLFGFDEAEGLNMVPMFP